MAIQAVIFDFGLVLSAPQDPAIYAEICRLAGLSREQFESLYWVDRHAYDEGKITGLEFWQKLLRDAKKSSQNGLAEQLSLLDGEMWCTANAAMVEWQRQLRQQGIRTAILSNMGDSVHESIARNCPWIQNFDVLVWSYQLKVAKPDATIYLHTLGQLGTRPEETLFVDDKLINIEAARALGINGFEFSTAARLRNDLIAAGLDKNLPLP